MCLMYKSCTWKEEKCDAKYITKQYTDMGLCYTINWNSSDILHSKNTGKQRIICSHFVLFCTFCVECIVGTEFGTPFGTFLLEPLPCCRLAFRRHFHSYE